MKLLICASEYYPYGAGIANVAYNVVEQLKMDGVECFICSPTGHIKCGNFKLIEKLGIIGLIYYWFQVYKYLQRYDFDVVWLHNPLILKNIVHPRCVATIHSTYHGKSSQRISPILYYKIASKIEKHCLNKLNEKVKFTSVSQQLNNELIEIGIDKDKIVSIINGVDTNRFQYIYNKALRDKLGLEDYYIILYVGRLASSKHVDAIIKCMPLILNKIKNVKLLLIGDGPQRADLDALARRLNIRDSIIMLGGIPNESLPLYYSMADVVVCPYSGLVLFEAMSVGKPIVAFNVEWHSEIIINMENGILVENLNVIEFSDAVAALLVNKNLSTELGNKAREYAIEKLDWTNVAKKYLYEFSNFGAKE